MNWNLLKGLTILGRKTHAHVIGPLALEQILGGNLALLTLVDNRHLVGYLFKLFLPLIRTVFRSLFIDTIIYGNSW